VTPPSESDERPLLSTGQVAALLQVDPRTVGRWSDTGRLDAVRTLGGHRRFDASQVDALLAQRATAPRDS
jgi:excisionase family DNA binding protein